MDYIINVDGVDIIIEREEKGPSVERDKLFEKYREIEEKTGQVMNNKRLAVLRKIAYSLSEEDAKEKNSKISSAEADFMLRMSAYAAKLLNVPEIKDIIEPVNELLDAYDDYDFESEKTVEINGNHFTFDPNKVDIESISKKLYALGEKDKDNYWIVEISDDGEVVLHW